MKIRYGNDTKSNEVIITLENRLETDLLALTIGEMEKLGLIRLDLSGCVEPLGAGGFDWKAAGLM